MARKIIMILLCLCVLVACGPPRYEKHTVQQDPLFEENYLVRDRDGHKVGYAVKVSEHEYMLFKDDGGKHEKKSKRNSKLSRSESRWNSPNSCSL